MTLYLLQGTDEDQDFVQNLALFLTAFFKVGKLRSPLPCSVAVSPQRCTQSAFIHAK